MRLGNEVPFLCELGRREKERFSDERQSTGPCSPSSSISVEKCTKRTTLRTLTSLLRLPRFTINSLPARLLSLPCPGQQKRTETEDGRTDEITRRRFNHKLSAKSIRHLTQHFSRCTHLFCCFLCLSFFVFGRVCVSSFRTVYSECLTRFVSLLRRGESRLK